MLATLERAFWPLRVPIEVSRRRGDLVSDFRQLIDDHAFPINPQAILDAGSGSGAGSMALRDVYPHTRIVAIDNAQNWQSYAIYRRRKPTSDISFIPMGITDFNPSETGTFDLIVAARICWDFSVSSITPWTQKAKAITPTLLMLLNNLGQNGALAMSWPSNERKENNFVKLLEDNFRIGELFTDTHRFFGPHDHWVAWQGFQPEKIEHFLSHPDRFLTKFALTSSDLDPYGLYEE